MIVYFDSSALVKRYLAEPDTEQVNGLLAQATLSGTSLITRAEVSAAIAKAARLNWLPREAATRAVRAFRLQWPSLVGIEVSEAVIIEADKLAWEYQLRGYDAVHLASAWLWQEGLGEIVTVATFDQALWSAAKQAGLEVWPKAL